MKRHAAVTDQTLRAVAEAVRLSQTPVRIKMNNAGGSLRLLEVQSPSPSLEEGYG